MVYKITLALYFSLTSLLCFTQGLNKADMLFSKGYYPEAISIYSKKELKTKKEVKKKILKSTVVFKLFRIT